ncbi:flagellin [Oceanobacillus massiliensis]|uniref:flagellin N-terminal helical domain-containing protein n=1 Tax=Oceanobacillus massiliensis TaxID=1465765 RepID=UPI000288A082|nr:flagellin [Oceanobacillus massiliensis]
MIINHNISALNAHRQLGANQSSTQSSLEKLSSGLGINKAGDDAAGLAISEKMRGQIRGLEQAQSNAQDGISLIQTAEGALNETHSILQRMRELAVQSGNDTNTDSDRAELQKEVDQLANALTDISEDTEFNTKNLLNGQFKGTFHVGANEGQNLSIEIGNMGAEKLGVTEDYTVVADAASATAEGDIYFQAETAGYDAQEVTADSTDGSTISYTDTEGNTQTATFDTDGYYNTNNQLVLGGPQLDADATADIAAGEGSEAGYYNHEDKLVIASETETHSAGDAVQTGINISSQESADDAITTIQSAIDTVSAERSKLGAVQNRLDHTINNLGTSAENLTAAESRIRDVDMAKEMMEFTKNNILSQAAQSMLAQSNQMPQGVLQLLQ